MSVHEDSDDSYEDLPPLNIPQQFASAADVVRMVRVEGERCDLAQLTGIIPSSAAWYQDQDPDLFPICPVFPIDDHAQLGLNVCP